jgi:hypothetical protein
MTARIVGNDRVGNPVAAKLEGRKGSTLIARPRLVDPHMNRKAFVVRLVNRRQGGAPIYGGEPPRIAVCENVQALTCLLLGEQALEHANAVQADQAIGVDVLVGHTCSAGIGRLDAQSSWKILHRAPHFIESPAQVHGRGPLLGKKRNGVIEAIIGWVVAKGETQAVCGRHPDQRRAPDLHRRYRPGGLLQGGQANHVEDMRQSGLIDDLHRPTVRRGPNRPEMLAVDFHRMCLVAFELHQDVALDAHRFQSAAAAELGQIDDESGPHGMATQTAN